MHHTFSLSGCIGRAGPCGRAGIGERGTAASAGPPKSIEPQTTKHPEIKFTLSRNDAINLKSPLKARNRTVTRVGSPLAGASQSASKLAGPLPSAWIRIRVTGRARVSCRAVAFAKADARAAREGGFAPAVIRSWAASARQTPYVMLGALCRAGPANFILIGKMRDASGLNANQ